MDLTRTVTGLVQLGADWSERCHGEKTNSCRKYGQPLSKLAMNEVLVVLFDFGGSVVLWQYGSGRRGL